MTSYKASITNLARRFRRLTQILLRYKNILVPAKPGYVMSRNKDKFNKSFCDTKSKEKLVFLEQLLKNNDELQNQFIHFTENKITEIDKKIKDKVRETRTDIINELVSLDFNDLVEDPYYYEDGYYMDELDVSNAHFLIENHFNDYIYKIRECLNNSKLLEAYITIIGLFEGVISLPGPSLDYYGFISDDYRDVASVILEKEFERLKDSIEKPVFTDEMIQNVFCLIAERYKQYEKDKRIPGDELAGYMTEFNLNKIDTVISPLIRNTAVANYTYALFKENNFDNYLSGLIFLKISELTGDKNILYEAADKYPGEDARITKILLEMFKKNDNTRYFNKVAKIALNKWSNIFDLYIIENIKQESDVGLYKKALKNYILREKSISHYSELRKYLSDEEKKDFLKHLSRKINVTSYVQILNVEKLFEEILEIAGEKLKYFYDLHNIIKPIVNVYPNECFDIISDVCKSAIKFQKRNRLTYQQMANLLIVMKQIKSKKAETKEFIRFLCTNRPILRAMIDEFKIAGVI